MNFKTFLERYGGAKEKMIMYHGTGEKNISKILSAGLVVKSNAVWDDERGMDSANWDTPSPKSMPGIYLTSNLLTAFSAARNSSGVKSGPVRKGLVIVSVQPRTLKPDEDDFVSSVKAVKILNLQENEYTIGNLYFSYKFDEDVSQDRENYVNKTLRSLIGKVNEVHPSLVERLRELLFYGWEIALQRRASHITDYVWARIQLDFDKEIERPDKKLAEKEFHNYAYQVSQTFKQMAWFHTSSGNLDYDGRVEEDITYSGKNKIIAVLVIDEKTIEVKYGKIPSDFIDQWNKRIGPFENMKIINRFLV